MADIRHSNLPSAADESAITKEQKVTHLNDLGPIVQKLRARGEVVVLCHGVFDLLHVGHVRHLEAAKREGTVLVVTLTADQYVNKGPDRPVFSEDLRAEMLAAVQCVDFVAINRGPSAETVLLAVRPDVYVKGGDYRNEEEDITGKIANERNAIEALGGRIVFTDEITFSSSNLINKHLGVYEPTLQKYLETLRNDGALPRLLRAIDAASNMKVLFVGDAIVDEYQYVVPLGKSPKENMIATLRQKSEAFAGGVFAAANHAASFCNDVGVLTCLGQEQSYEELIRSSLKANVSLDFVVHAGAPTTRKTRFVDHSYSVRKLFEVYDMDDGWLSSAAENDLLDLLRDKVAAADVVVVTDFGHGLMSPRVIDLLTEESKFLAVNAQSNSANHGYNLITKYKSADYICIDGPEARLAVGDKYGELADVVSKTLPSRIACDRIVVTQGKHGCWLYKRGESLHAVPALTSSIVDTVGAGDAFFAVTAPMVAAGALMPDIGLLGNVAGAMKVGIVGHRSSVEKVPFIKFLTTLLK
jgi:rfaE bifunctional protein nucleotidyltransferase chain/domain